MDRMSIYVLVGRSSTLTVVASQQGVPMDSLVLHSMKHGRTMSWCSTVQLYALCPIDLSQTILRRLRMS